MEENIQVIVELSDAAQELLDRQGVDLFHILQQELPSLRLRYAPDPIAPQGSRDIVPVLYGAAAVITAITPILLAILKQFTPPNRTKTWVIDETETRHPDGTVVTQRKHIRSTDEHRPGSSTEETPSPQLSKE